MPALVFCSAFGATPEDALRDLQVAKCVWLEAVAESDKPLSFEANITASSNC